MPSSAAGSAVPLAQPSYQSMDFIALAKSHSVHNAPNGRNAEHSASVSSSSSSSSSSVPSRTAIKDTSYGYLTGVAITINFAIGTGMFILPYAMTRAGWMLALSCLCVFIVASCTCLAYVIESMARTGGLIAADAGAKALDHASRKGIDSIHNHADSEEEEQEPLLLEPSSLPGHYLPQIGRTKIDYITMCDLFLGGVLGSSFVQLCMALYSLGVLWAYAAVFSASVDTLFFQYVLDQECNIYAANTSAECTFGYVCSVFLFALIVTYLSLQDISEQAAIQSLLTVYRFAAILMMLVTCLYAFGFKNMFDRHADPPPLSFAHLPVWRNEGFALTFGATAVALDLHWNAADFLAPLRRKEKALIMALSGLGISSMLYCLIMIVCALEFGAATMPLVTLNWAHYTGLRGGFSAPIIDRHRPEQSEFVPWWATCIKMFIICFPIVNQCSVYPLVVATLADNYVALVPRFIASRYHPHTIKTTCRLLACLPPIAFALCFGKIDAIFAFTGLFAFMLVFVIPCLLQLRSCAVVKQRFGPGSEHTIYSSVFSHPFIVGSLLLFGICAFFISISNLLNDITLTKAA